MSEPLDLSEFEPATRADWQRRIDSDGRAAAPRERSLASWVDGISIEALYPMRAPQVFATSPGEGPSFRIGSEYALPDPRRLAAALRADFHYGLEAAWIRLHPSSRSRVRVDPSARLGVMLSERHDVAALFDAVPSGGRVWFDAGANALSIYALALEAREEASSSNSDPRSRHGWATVLSDPLGAWVETGVLGVSLEHALDDQSKLLSRAKVESPEQPVLLASGTMFHDAGASAAIEIGAIVATAIEYVRSLAGRGHDQADALSRLVLRCSVDSDVLGSLAKVRALRHLWSRVCSTLGGGPGPAWVSVRAGWRNRTRHDPWINLLRGTVEGFSAAAGGADEVCFQPCSEVIGVPAEDQRRWAIGTGLVLREESHLGQVHDPAAGCGAVEAITGAMVEGAWTFVREIERAGGMAAAIAAGVPQGATAQAAAERRLALERSQLTLTGVTLYPKLDEAMLGVSPIMAPVNPPEHPQTPVLTAQPLTASRLAEPFERLRDASLRYRATHGEFPGALIVELGDPTEHRGRLDFTRSVVSVGGFAPRIAPLGDLPAAPGPHTKLAVLCGTDAVLEEQAVSAVATLRQAGFEPVFIAASPKRLAEAVRGCADGFFYQGMAVASVMHEIQAQQGVQS